MDGHSTVAITELPDGSHTHVNSPKTDRAHRDDGITNPDAPHRHASDTPKGFRKIRFTFAQGGESEPTYDGFTDGAEWNGWAVVRVTKATLLQIVGDAALQLALDSAPSDYDPAKENGVSVVQEDDFNTIQVGIGFMENVFDFAFIKAGEDGLYSLDGYTTAEVK